MKIFQIVKKVTAGGGAFIASVVEAGIELSQRFTLSPATSVAPAISVDATRQSARIAQNPAVSTSLLGADGTAVNQLVNPAVVAEQSLRDVAATSTQQNPAVVVEQSLRDVAATSTQQNPAVATTLIGATGTAVNQDAKPAIATTAVITDFKITDVPALEMVQVKYDLIRHVGANAAANLGPQNWTNPNNATGLKDGSNATSAGNLTAAQDFNLELNYANSVNKGDLVISAVRLDVYARVTGDATGLQSTVTISYDVGAGYVVLETILGNFDNLGTARSYDLTGILDTWAKYDAFKVKVRHQTAIAATLVAGAVDAAEIDVTASKTDAL